MKQERMLLGAALIVLLAASTQVACKKHKDDPNPPAGVKTAYVEAVHASPRTADIDVKIDGVNIPTRVKYLDKSGAASPVVLDIPSLKLEKGKTFSLYLYGLISGVGDSKLGLQVLTHK